MCYSINHNSRDSHIVVQEFKRGLLNLTLTLRMSMPVAKTMPSSLCWVYQYKHKSDSGAWGAQRNDTLLVILLAAQAAMLLFCTPNLAFPELQTPCPFNRR